jgi:hypothetical protein
VPDMEGGPPALQSASSTVISAIGTLFWSFQAQPLKLLHRIRSRLKCKGESALTHVCLCPLYLSSNTHVCFLYRCILSGHKKTAVKQLFLNKNIMTQFFSGMTTSSVINLQVKVPGTHQQQSPAQRPLGGLQGAKLAMCAEVSLNTCGNKGAGKLGKLKGCLDGYVRWQVLGYEKVSDDSSRTLSAFLSWKQVSSSLLLSSASLRRGWYGACLHIGDLQRGCIVLHCSLQHCLTII